MEIKKVDCGSIVLVGDEYNSGEWYCHFPSGWSFQPQRFFKEEISPRIERGEVSWFRVFGDPNIKNIIVPSRLSKEEIVSLLQKLIVSGRAFVNLPGGVTKFFWSND